MRDAHLAPGLVPPSVEVVPGDWRALRLGDVASNVGGGRLRLTKERDYRSAGFPAYSAAGQDGFVERWEFETSAVVIPSIGSIGTAYRAEGRWTTLANTQVIFPRPELLDHRFLHHRINDTGFWPISGTAQPFIKPSDVGRCWISLPPLPEQRQIAEILDTLDEAIHKTEEIIAKLKQVKQGLLYDLLTRGIDDHGELRDADRHPEQFTDSPLGRIPKGWSCVPVGTLAAVTVGHVGPINEFFTESDHGVPLLSTSHIGAEGQICGRIRRVTRAFDAVRSKTRVGSGDLIVARHGKSGSAALVPDTLPVAQSLNVVIVRQSPGFDSTYLTALLNHAPVRTRLLGGQAGSVQPIVGTRGVAALLLPLAPLHEQKVIASLTSVVLSRLVGEGHVLGKLSLLKQGLMEDLLTGRVRVTKLLEYAAE